MCWKIKIVHTEKWITFVITSKNVFNSFKCSRLILNSVSVCSCYFRCVTPKLATNSLSFKEQFNQSALRSVFSWQINFILQMEKFVLSGTCYNKLKSIICWHIWYFRIRLIKLQTPTKNDIEILTCYRIRVENWIFKTRANLIG